MFQKRGLSVSIIDSLLVTLLSTVACVVLPKFLSTLFAQESKQVEVASTTLKQGSAEVPSFPY